jgi:hypothetical protein
MAVVAVELLEARGTHQGGQRRAAFDAVALESVGVGKHMRLTGQRHPHAGRRQVIADGLFTHRQRHAIPGGAVGEHVAAGVVTHARGAADAGLHIGVREQHAAPGEAVDRRRFQVRMSGARQMIGAQLVAHDEQNVLDLAHASFLPRRQRRSCPI